MMLKILGWSTLTLLLVTGLTGCKGEPWFADKKPETPVATGATTKAEVLAELEAVIAPLKAAVYPPGADTTVFGDDTRHWINTALREAQAAYGDKDFGREALRDTAEEIRQIAREAANQERWRVVEAAIDAFEILGLESAMLARLDDRAKVMMAQPKVLVKGFMDDIEKKDIYVFLELIDRRTQERTRVTAREGDIFNGLRLVRIIGRNKSVLFEYIPIEGLFFEVEGVRS